MFARPVVGSKRRSSFGNVLGVHSNSPGRPAARTTERFQNSRSHHMPTLAKYSPGRLGYGTMVTFAFGPIVRSIQSKTTPCETEIARPDVPSWSNSFLN